MIRLLMVVISIIVTVILVSCNDTTAPESEAVLMERNEISKIVGYTWLSGSITAYTPDDSLTNLISTTFNSDRHKFIIFLEPDCSCKELVEAPAYLIKVLDASNIASQYYEIYATGSKFAKHPYKEIFSIYSLPTVTLINPENKTYSILDTFNYRRARTNDTIKIESIVLEALEKI